MKNSPLNLLAKTALALFAALMIAPTGMASPKDTLDAKDVKFVKHEAAAGTAVVKLAGLAVQKAGRPEVKAFAETLVTDHTGANTELAGLAKTKGVELSATVAPATAEAFQKLEKSTPADFDKDYLADVVSGHKKCVKNFEEASTNAKDAEVKAWATKMLPTLKAHLAKAQELAK